MHCECIRCSRNAPLVCSLQVLLSTSPSVNSSHVSSHSRASSTPSPHVHLCHSLVSCLAHCCAPPRRSVIDFRTLIRSLKEQNGVATALRYPDRVRKIVIIGQNLVLDKVYGTMNHPFPTLETFELFNPLVAAFEVPTTIFKGSAPSLRHLYLEKVIYASVYQLLSSTTCLVELNSDTDAILCLSLAASLLTHLQGMPCLRRLQLHVLDRSSPIPVFNMRPQIVFHSRS